MMNRNPADPMSDPDGWQPPSPMDLVLPETKPELPGAQDPSLPPRKRYEPPRITKDVPMGPQECLKH